MILLHNSLYLPHLPKSDIFLFQQIVHQYQNQMVKNVSPNNGCNWKYPFGVIFPFWVKLFPVFYLPLEMNG